MAEECNFINTLGYLLMQVSKAQHDRARELLSQIGIYNGQEQILLQLRQEDRQSQATLAEKLCIQPATLTKSLNRMEKSGLSQRLPSPYDRRSTQVHMTEHGQELCTAVDLIWQNLEFETFNILSSEEQMLLRHLLDKVRANLLESKLIRNS